jgi:6-phosphogluconate dehydrogenase
MRDLTEARLLAQQFPNAVIGLTLSEIEEIWSEWSDNQCASWLIPDAATVEGLFSHWAKYRRVPLGRYWGDPE